MKPRTKTGKRPDVPAKHKVGEKMRAVQPIGKPYQNPVKYS